jgi:hypothetical protein
VLALWLIQIQQQRIKSALIKLLQSLAQLQPQIKWSNYEIIDINRTCHIPDWLLHIDDK